MAERKGKKVTKVPKPKRIGTKSRTAFGAERPEMRWSNGVVERRHTKVPIGRPKGGGRPGRRAEGGESASYKAYLESRRQHYGLTELGRKEQEKSRRSESERKERRLAKANREAEKERRVVKRKAVARPRKKRAP